MDKNTKKLSLLKTVWQNRPNPLKITKKYWNCNFFPWFQVIAMYSWNVAKWTRRVHWFASKTYFLTKKHFWLLFNGSHSTGGQCFLWVSPWSFSWLFSSSVAPYTRPPPIRGCQRTCILQKLYGGRSDRCSKR